MTRNSAYSVHMTTNEGLPQDTRTAMYTDIYQNLGLAGHGVEGCEAHDGECADNWGQGYYEDQSDDEYYAQYPMERADDRLDAQLSLGGVVMGW